MLKPDFADMRAHFKASQAIVLVGGRAFVAYPYRDAEPVPEGVAVLHIADNPEAFGREQPAHMALLGDIGLTLAAAAGVLGQLVDQDKVAARLAARAAHTREARQATRLDILAESANPPLTPDAAVLAALDALPQDALIANDSAATFGRVQDLLTTQPGRYFFARGGVLGCSMPAAVGAALATRGWVASFVGDGGAMYSPQALWSAARYRARVIFLVFNNRRYGVLQNVARQLGYVNAVAGRFVGMEVADPAIDFQALAASMGVPAARADDRHAIGAAVHRALGRARPVADRDPDPVSGEGPSSGPAGHLLPLCGRRVAPSRKAGEGGEGLRRPYQLRFNLRRLPERLQHDAIALGEPEQRVELVLRRVGIELEFEPDGGEAYRRVLCDAERAAKVEIAFRLDLARAHSDAHRRRDRFQRHAGAGDQRLEQHVAGAQLRAASSGRGMKPGDRKRPSGLDLAGDRGGIERAASPSASPVPPSGRRGSDP